MAIDLNKLGFVVGILALIYAVYNRIKSDCIKKAMEKVAEAENHTELTGIQRYQMALDNLEKEFPGTFIRSLIRNILGELIKHVYKNNKEFAEGYAKVQTGQSIDEIVENLTGDECNTSEDMITDECES